MACGRAPNPCHKRALIHILSNVVIGIAGVVTAVIILVVILAVIGALLGEESEAEISNSPDVFLSDGQEHVEMKDTLVETPTSTKPSQTRKPAPDIDALVNEQWEHWERLSFIRNTFEEIERDGVMSTDEAKHFCFVSPQWLEIIEEGEAYIFRIGPTLVSQRLTLKELKTSLETYRRVITEIKDKCAPYSPSQESE